MNSAVVPAFDVEGGLALTLARGLFVAALLAVFGTVLFATVVAPRALARGDAEVAARARRRLLGLALVELAATLLALPVWLVAQAADMASAMSIMDAAAAAPTVLTDTAFGHLLLAQGSMLVAAGLALGWQPALPSVRLRLATVLLAVAVAMQAGHGHAWAMYGRPSLLLLSGVLHLLAAGGWLGGLVPLLLMVRDAPFRVGAAAARWYSPLGKWCVAGVVISSAWQFWQLIGGLPGLLGTAYGWIAGLKLALLGVLFGFAVLNRYRLAPALLRASPERARRKLVGSIAVQTGFGVLTVLAAGVLSSLPPAVHEQPMWPFPDRLSLDTVRGDPGFRDEVIGAALALAGAVLAVLVVSLLHRRLRWVIWPTVAAATGIAWLAMPHLGLLLVEAYPTSYYHSPTNFVATAIVHGATLFPQHCAVCHGPEGRGNGPAAASLPVPPADLTAAHLWMHSDGELFWWLTHGIEAPEGGVAMPGFADVLSPDDRWDLIDYVRAHNAGLVVRSSGTWTPPVQAPGLQAECSGGRSVSLADLQGGFVRLVFDAAPSLPGPVPGVTAILVGADLAIQPAPGFCVARDGAVPRAYAIVSGTAPNELAGTQFLIDGNGWLRAMQRPSRAPGWDDPDKLLAAMRQLQAHPVAASVGMDHAHMQM